MLAAQLVREPVALGGGAIITVLTPAQRAALPPALTPADIGGAAMRFLGDDTRAGRIMVCRGGEPSRLLPLVDWQIA